jgi:serine/threonine-protein kinase
MLGERLGKWVIYKELGRGGMGRVYLAHEELGERQAALKVLAPELAQDAGFLHRFQREIDALSVLNHPNIVKFYESGFEQGLYFYVMEYVEGQSLEDILQEQHRLPWQEVLDAALQICPALKHAHDHGIIHRDIKPPNLLRTPAGVIKLSDFGIAKVFAGTHLTATGGVVGTAEYLSPEQAAGKPVTKRSDLYSLGVVLYTLLTGRTPFEGETYLELLHKHCYAQFDRPQRIVPEIPYELDEAVCQLLEKDPANRPADCLVFGRQLERIRARLDRKGQRTDAGDSDQGTVAENTVPVGNPGPGPATLMSRLVRAELDRQNQPLGLSRLVNRVWILLPLFVLCVGAIVWTFWPESQETLFQRGAELMASDDPAAWERAWKDFLQPLNERFPEHPHREAVDKFRRRIEAARQSSDARRFFRQGERYLQDGNVAAAQRVWNNLVAVFGPDESAAEWVTRAQRELADLAKMQAAGDRLGPVRAALKRAQTLNAEGNGQEAERIWNGVEELYRDDPSARDLVKEARAARDKR